MLNASDQKGLDKQGSNVYFTVIIKQTLSTDFSIIIRGIELDLCNFPLQQLLY